MKKKYRMSRGGRLALNLVLLCVLVGLIWGLLGFSSPTLRGRFRRVAQANWADPLEIQGVLPCDGQRWVLAAGQDQVILWQDGRDGLEYWPRDPNGATLVPVPEMRTAQGEIRLDLQQPAGAARGSAAADPAVGKDLLRSGRTAEGRGGPVPYRRGGGSG